jgi:streptogramin lyase
VNRHVWVISSNQARITSIDVESARRNGPQPYIGRGSAAITRDGGTVWVASRGRRAVLGIAARSGKVTRHLDTPLPPTRVAAGKSGLWVVGRAAPGGPATLLHYDRDGQQPLGQAEFPDGIAAITLGAGYLWVAPERARRVMRVPPSGEPEHGGWLTAPASDLAFGEGYLWAGVTDGSVARIDPRRKLSRTRAAARRPAQLAVAGHHVFLAGNTEDVIVVIDPKTGRPVPRRLPVPGNPYGVAAGAGHVWVTGMAGNTLTRLDY